MSPRRSILLTMALVAALSACKKKVDEDAAMPSGGEPATLVGTWNTDGPVSFSGEGLRTTMEGGRTVYHPDKTFDYSGRLTIFGNALPTEGVSFRVTGKGAWQQDGSTLSEDYTAVTVQSEHDDAALKRLAGQLATELRDQPATESAVIELSADRLELRDRTTDRLTSYTRQPAG
jgi:hypothetical protein